MTSFLSNIKTGRVTGFILKKYGHKAFKKNGDLKLEYEKKALQYAKDKGDESLRKAVQLAINMRKWKK